MEIKFEKNGSVVTISNMEDLVTKNDIPEFVENMLWHIGQSDVMKKRKNTIYGEGINSRNNAKPKNVFYYQTEGWKDIVFETFADANECLKCLVDIQDKYGAVTVSDFYDMAGVRNPIAFMKDTYGWVSVKEGFVGHFDEGFKITLPAPMKLEDQ